MTSVFEPGLTQVAEGVIVRDMLAYDDSIDRYLGDLLRRGKAQRTLDTYRRTLEEFCDTLPEMVMDVAEITDQHIRRYLDKFNSHSPAYRAQKDSILRGHFGWLYFEGKIKSHPMERMLPPRRVRDEDKDVVTVSTDEVKAMLAAASGWTERLTLGILCYLGPRRHAASSLRLSDFDRKNGRLRFREKGGKVIWKPVPDALCVLLEAAIAAGTYNIPNQDVQDPYLIPSTAVQRRPGERDDRIIWKTVRNIADRAGVRCHTHALRAAFAVFYLEQGGDLASLQDLMGHRSGDTTKIYLRRLSKEQQMEKVRELTWA